MVSVSTQHDIQATWLKDAFDSGFRRNAGQDSVDGKLAGLVRVMPGTISIVADVDRLVDTVAEKLVDKGEAGWSADRSTTCMWNRIAQCCRGLLKKLL
jgi:hypothetical protein